MRPESLYFLFSPITRIKGVGGATAKALERLLPVATVIDGATMPTIRDLLFHLPVGIVDRRFTCALNSAPDGAVATFVVMVEQHFPPPAMRRGGKKPYKVLCSNNTGDITLVFFNAHEDYIKGALPVGGKRVISGKVEYFDYRLQMTHPDIIAPVEQLAEVQKPEPVYPLTIGITTRRIAKIVNDALEKLPELPEWQAADAKLPSWKSALRLAHHPQSEEDLLPAAPARMRLAYDEILANQLYLGLLRRRMQQQAGEAVKGTGALTGALIESLPFSLTAGQRQVLEDIYADMESGHRMGRLLQGDVGSGKTVVALLAMLRAVEQGLQAAFMVPTEIVAQQHFEVISKMLAGLKPCLEESDVFPPPLRGRVREGGYLHGYEGITADRAKQLRNEPTDAEKKLWQYLRKGQMEHFKFRRQQPVGSYIVDFFSSDARLIIELDGGQHADRQKYDEKRTRFLESRGYRVLRFWNNDVMENIEGIYQAIADALKNAPPPNPLPQGEGGLHVVLLTGSVKGKARQDALDDIASGRAQIIIGTHALFQEHVEFHKLALAVIDEQHRFGVGQRMALTAKGDAPHVLHLTATPIPRSLTMTLYGDMDCSQLKEKPAERQPIATRVIPLRRYGEIMDRLQAALDRGEKAYWVCPLIEDSIPALVAWSGSMNDRTPPFGGDSDIAAAKSRFTEFKARFGPVVGLVHGRMKADERDAQMRAFASGGTRLLVATTVVEVGVDVRDATIMVIEQAEHFGLSQLHQLRGRVGRGDKPSSCVLLYNEAASEQWLAAGEERFLASRQPLAASRLSILRETEDGFRIAEEDLRLRGGGDLLGARQSGMPRFIFTDLLLHRELIEQARDDVKRLLAADPQLSGARAQALKLLLQLFGFDAPPD